MARNMSAHVAAIMFSVRQHFAVIFLFVYLCPGQFLSAVNFCVLQSDVMIGGGILFKRELF